MPEDNRIIYDRTGKRRVRVFRHADGSFRFIEEAFSDDELELFWLPLTSRRSQPICDSFETALREAQGRVPWLAEKLTPQ